MSQTTTRPSTIGDFCAYRDLTAIDASSGIPVYWDYDLADRPATAADKALPLSYVPSGATADDVIRCTTDSDSPTADAVCYSLCGDGADLSPVPAYWTVAEAVTPRQVLTTWGIVNTGRTVVDHDDTWGNHPDETCPISAEEFAEQWIECMGPDADRVGEDADGDVPFEWPAGIAFGHVYTITEAVCSPCVWAEIK